MGQGVGADIHFVAVLALVDPHAPQYDAGMVTVLQHHLPGVFHGLILPAIIADVLPAGDLGEDDQTKPVAFVDEILALGIVGGTHRHTAQLLFENAGILPLQALRCGVTHVREALVTVKATQESLFAVEIKTVVFKLNGAHAKFYFLGILQLAVSIQQFAFQNITVGIIHAPQLCVGEMQVGRGCGFSGQKAGAILFQNRQAAKVSALGFDLCMDHVRPGGGDENILDKCLFPHIQPGFPIKSAVGQIVDDEAKRGRGGVFRGVQLYGDQCILSGCHQIRNLDPETGVAGAVMSCLLAIDIDSCDVAGTVKLQKQPLSGVFCGDGQLSAVAADHLIRIVVAVVGGEISGVVGQADGNAFPLTQAEGVGPFLGVHWKD